MNEELKKLISDTIDTITDAIDGDMDTYPELAEINERLWDFLNKNLNH